MSMLLGALVAAPSAAPGNLLGSKRAKPAHTGIRTAVHSVRVQRKGIAILLVATAGFTAFTVDAGAHHSLSGIPFDNMSPTLTAPAECANGPNICRTDGLSVEAYVLNLGPVMRERTEFTLDASYHTTDLNVSYASSSSVSYSGCCETDIIYNTTANSAMPIQNVAGVAVCDDSVSSTVCDQFYIHYQQENVNDNLTDLVYLRKLACHETGHAVGLVHGQQSYPIVSNTTHTQISCMVTGYSTAQLLGVHNQSAINLQY